jgi:hypothetical protein
MVDYWKDTSGSKHNNFECGTALRTCSRSRERNVSSCAVLEGDDSQVDDN